jgi:hypothetical protein
MRRLRAGFVTAPPPALPDLILRSRAQRGLSKDEAIKAETPGLSSFETPAVAKAFGGLLRMRV